MTSRIFISTGGLKNKNAYETCIDLNNLGLTSFELSGGKYFNEVLPRILKLEKKGFQIQLHNYFPVPEIPFVLNLASQNKKISKLSIDHCRNSIYIASKLNFKRYSVHAGFCIDPSTKELGQPFKKNIHLKDRNHYLNTFLERVKDLNKYAKSLNVDLYIENNVSIKENVFSGESLLLCSNAEEIKKMIFETGAKFLLDTGHLIVSAKSLNLDENKEFKTLRSITSAYHLSSNNRLRDQNKAIKEDESILNQISKKGDFYTLEVYMSNKVVLENYQFIKDWLNN